MLCLDLNIKLRLVLNYKGILIDKDWSNISRKTIRFPTFIAAII